MRNSDCRMRLAGKLLLFLLLLFLMIAGLNRLLTEEGPIPQYYRAGRPCDAVLLGKTAEKAEISLGGETVSLAELVTLNEGVLEDIYPTRVESDRGAVESFSFPERSAAAPAVRTARPPAWTSATWRS